jgi:hypothetical protein
MATDRNGRNLNVGDVVVKVGSSDRFIIEDITCGGDMVDLNGNWIERNVPSNGVIKVG